MSVKVDINNDGKADFSINITQIIAVASLFASIIGSYYTLKAKIEQNTQSIERAMQMPAQSFYSSSRKYGQSERPCTGT